MHRQPFALPSLRVRRLRKATFLGVLITAFIVAQRSKAAGLDRAVL